MNQFTYLGSDISSTEKDVNINLMKAWNATDRLSIIWKSDLSDKIKEDFLKAVAVSILLCRCTIWMLIKCRAKELNANYARMLHAILNKSWKQHLKKQQQSEYLPCISQTIQIRWTKHVRHSWRSKGKTHKQHYFIDFCTLALSGYKIQPKRPARSDRCLGMDGKR